MRTFSHRGRVVTYSRVGLMVLREHVRQRSVDATPSSFRGMLPLTTPSGPQHVESELEAELLQQLAFSPDVYDLLTQLEIDYTVDGRPRRYTPDILVQLHASGDDAPCRYVIEVKRRADLLAHASQYAIKFAAGRLAAEEMGAAFRIMDETRIQTAYLHNTKLLQRHRANDPELVAVDVMRREIGTAAISVVQAIELLREHGVEEPDARASIEQSVAWRMILCDLATPFIDDTLIRARASGALPPRDDDSILRALLNAESA